MAGVVGVLGILLIAALLKRERTDRSRPASAPRSGGQNGTAPIAGVSHGREAFGGPAEAGASWAPWAPRDRKSGARLGPTDGIGVGLALLAVVGLGVRVALARRRRRSRWSRLRVALAGALDELFARPKRRRSWFLFRPGSRRQVRPAWSGALSAAILLAVAVRRLRRSARRPLPIEVGPGGLGSRPAERAARRLRTAAARPPRQVVTRAPILALLLAAGLVAVALARRGGCDAPAWWARLADSRSDRE